MVIIIVYVLLVGLSRQTDFNYLRKMFDFSSFSPATSSSSSCSLSPSFRLVVLVASSSPLWRDKFYHARWVIPSYRSMAFSALRSLAVAMLSVPTAPHFAWFVIARINNRCHLICQFCMSFAESLCRLNCSWPSSSTVHALSLSKSVMYIRQGRSVAP